MKQNPVAGNIIGFREVVLTELNAAKKIAVNGKVIYEKGGPIGEYQFWSHPQGLYVSHPSWSDDVDVSEEYNPHSIMNAKGVRTIKLDKDLSIEDYVVDTEPPRVMRRWVAPAFEEQ